MIVRWTRTAIRDLDAMHDYIASDSPEAARSVVATVLDPIEHLTRHPEIGRRGRVPGTRELVVAPYVVAYRAGGEAVEIVAILHGARRWPGRL